MRDIDKTKEQLINELKKLRQQIKELEASEAELRKVEGALQEAEEYYRQFIENSPNPIFSVDKKGIIHIWNQACERVFQYAAEEIMGKKYHRLLLKFEDISAVEEMMDQVWEGFTLDNQEITFLAKDGTQRETISGLFPLHNRDGRFNYCIFTNTDITGRKQARKENTTSLKEKEVLLEEVHHRVRNNMQVICSLLNLQSRQIKDKRTLEMFKETKNRVRSMALIHERLYRSDDLTKIDFNYYVRALINNLFHSYQTDTNVTKIKINVENVFFNINAAIPCGLIINELVSNSLKHAFPDGKVGEISIDLFLVGKDKYSLTVKDDGVGFPKDLDYRKTDSLGMQLVTMLVDQLKGDIELKKNQGTEFQIVFEEK